MAANEDHITECAGNDMRVIYKTKELISDDDSGSVVSRWELRKSINDEFEDPTCKKIILTHYKKSESNPSLDTEQEISEWMSANSSRKPETSNGSASASARVRQMRHPNAPNEKSDNWNGFGIELKHVDRPPSSKSTISKDYKYDFGVELGPVEQQAKSSQKRKYNHDFGVHLRHVQSPVKSQSTKDSRYDFGVRLKRAQPSAKSERPLNNTSDFGVTLWPKAKSTGRSLP